MVVDLAVMLPAQSSSQAPPVLAIGLMSGTSQDGVDVALIETDGEVITRFGQTAYRPYGTDERALMRSATAAAANLTERTARSGVIAAAEQCLNAAHAEAVATFLAANDVAADAVTVIGFHGQTVLHRPERGLTIQIGDGSWLAARLGIPVVYDFRAADMAAGGQGAPLAPVFHRALVRRLDVAPPVAVLNIGGVANVTFIDGEDLIACDTGPGNALLDDFLRLRTGRLLDTDGCAAAAGVVDDTAIARVLAHPFFGKPPPKSLDRNDCRGWVGAALDDRSVEDGAATLTAAAVARIVPLLPRAPKTWIVAGGGARNPTLMRMLAQRLAPARVETGHEAGWSVDSLEAQALAYLAVRSIRGLPITLPATTGVPRPLTGGVLARP
ncbi:MAG TPA: anhydro-N-acetylmuramic acid kinase [Xanthobacteraceae bacterium]|nr:anhydro-N-acetylmuramic acid kinase [Xanthobacteraceae bacterium]